MLKRPLVATAATLASSLAFETTTTGADCPVEHESVWDMSAEDITDCMEAAMADAYAKKRARGCGRLSRLDLDLDPPGRSGCAQPQTVADLRQ